MYIYSKLIQIIINFMGRSFRLIVTFDFLCILHSYNANYIMPADNRSKSLTNSCLANCRDTNACRYSIAAIL